MGGYLLSWLTKLQNFCRTTDPKLNNGVSSYQASVQAWKNGEIKEFERLTRESASKGHEIATYNLAVILEAQGNIQDMVSIYQELSKNGFGPANLSLGHCRRFGIGLPMDLNIATRYYQKAANPNNPFSDRRNEAIHCAKDTDLLSIFCALCGYSDKDVLERSNRRF